MHSQMVDKLVVRCIIEQHIVHRRGRDIELGEWREPRISSIVRSMDTSDLTQPPGDPCLIAQVELPIRIVGIDRSIVQSRCAPIA